MSPPADIMTVMDKPDAETLRRLYVDELRSMADIASPYGVSSALVRKWLLRAGIQPRTKQQARAVAKKYTPTEEHKEKLRQNAERARSRITSESRIKQSQTRLRLGIIPVNKGVPMGEEQRQKLIELRSDPEYRRKMSEMFSGEKSPNWKGGIKPEHSRRLDRAEWRRLRAEVYERDNWTCQECGCKCLNTRDSKNHPKRKIQCHHIVARRNGGEDTMENLVTLCMSCHHKLERKTKE